ncbi:conserved protein of unknown function [Tenacibaculum sp. 190130A14a]|uniref:Uncharacterized protein n=1 Tax=Tenacibaculum polynesiense TaxID=3137857 RepID=A0ABM9PAX5_9FLAO
MILQEALTNFYNENKLEQEGGSNNNWFYLHFKLFSIKVPNSEFRKKVIHIHDIQHVLYNCDTTWKGEAFIAGWEVATGMWKHLPIGLMSVWAMGFSLLNYPSEVMRGYKEGLKVIGIIDLNMDKNQLLQLTISEIQDKIKRKHPLEMNIFQKGIFLFWTGISVVSVLFPAFLLIILYLIF